MGKREYSYTELGQKLKSQIVKAEFREKRNAKKKDDWRNKNAQQHKANRNDKQAFQGNAAFKDFAGLQEAGAQEIESKQLIDIEAASIEITAILDDFKTRGWLSDERYTEQMVHARKAKFGVSKIAHELRQKGVSDELVASAIEKVKDNELENAREIWQKKYKDVPATREEWAKQARFLQSRGFGFDTIKKVLNIKDNDD